MLFSPFFPFTQPGSFFWNLLATFHVESKTQEATIGRHGERVDWREDRAPIHKGLQKFVERVDENHDDAYERFRSTVGEGSLYPIVRDHKGRRMCITPVLTQPNFAPIALSHIVDSDRDLSTSIQSNSNTTMNALSSEAMDVMDTMNAMNAVNAIDIPYSFSSLASHSSLSSLSSSSSSSSSSSFPSLSSSCPSSSTLSLSSASIPLSPIDNIDIRIGILEMSEKDKENKHNSSSSINRELITPTAITNMITKESKTPVIRKSKMRRAKGVGEVTTPTSVTEKADKPLDSHTSNITNVDNKYDSDDEPLIKKIRKNDIKTEVKKVSSEEKNTNKKKTHKLVNTPTSIDNKSEGLPDENFESDYSREDRTISKILNEQNWKLGARRRESSAKIYPEFCWSVGKHKHTKSWSKIHPHLQRKVLSYFKPSPLPDLKTPAIDKVFPKQPKGKTPVVEILALSLSSGLGSP